MFFSFETIKSAFSELVKLDVSEGKRRQERLSGLRYLLAASQLLKKQGVSEISLAPGSSNRQEFIHAVGDVVALNNDGLYSIDFNKEFGNRNDYGVGSNFFTTRLANSRHQDIKYPGRPAPVLFLSQEAVRILDDVGSTLVTSYGVDNIKAELAIWLLRNESVEGDQSKLNAKELHKQIVSKIKEKYSDDVAVALAPSEKQVDQFLDKVSGYWLANEKPDFAQLANQYVVHDTDPVKYVARVLSNDLPDEDPILEIVHQLLARGSKGILFSGPPGTSKTWYALKIALKLAGGDEERLERVQFHPSFTYEDFIEGLVSAGAVSGTDPLFKPKDKVFLNLCEKARKDLDSSYILIIDEFSRGDPSRIFGELLTYIEPDYRGIKFKLPYSERETDIPQNVIIFATMNPYDKSVIDLDSAMERRFDVIELLPSSHILKRMLVESGVAGPVIGNVISFFNTANKLSPHGFGHTYFKDLVDDLDFVLLWNHKLKFLFEKMFRFQDDAYNDVRGAFINIVSDENKEKIA